MTSDTAKTDLSVIVPVYNEEGNLPLLHERLSKTLAEAVPNHEILLVDDGSTDRSPVLLREIRQRDAKVRVIKLLRNYGQQAAILAGMESSRGGRIVIMDGDLQNPPEEIPKLLEPLKDGTAIVYGERIRRKDSFLRRLLHSCAFFVAENLLGIRNYGSGSGFVAMDRKAVQSFLALPERKLHIPLLVSLLGYRSATVPIRHDQRASEKSKYNFRRLFRHFLNLAVMFSERPLQIAGVTGFVTALLSFGYGAFILTRYFFQKTTVPGYTSLFIAVVFLSGLQMILIGILGAYVASIHQEVKRRPAYIIESEP